MKYTAREKHANIISDFLIFLNKVTDKFVLKGGTALAKCYNLDRFEDIDLDSEKGNITSIVKNYCKSKNFTYCEKKNTSYGQRFMIDYKVDRQLLKVEVRLNEKINKDDVCKINGIIVYKINRLTLMKLQAYDSRDKIRDMYDIAFIINNY
jgi:predicted nucleotidyltransferase component of viral defense system